MPMNFLNITLKAVRNVKGLVLGSTKAAVCQIDSAGAADDPRLWYASRVDDKH